MINEEKLINLLFEGNETLVVKNDETFHLEDFIEYFNKPGLIVATIKGDSDCGIQQLPIGAVDNFRFMQITNEDAIINQNKNNGKSYDEILKEYEVAKCGIIDQWKKMNADKFMGLRNKYGNRFLGMDIVENKKKIEHKEEAKDDVKTGKEVSSGDEKSALDKNVQAPTQGDNPQITEDEILEDTMIGDESRTQWDNLKSLVKSLFSDKESGIREIIKTAKSKGKDGVKQFSNVLVEKHENDNVALKLELKDGTIYNIGIKDSNPEKYVQVVNGDILLLTYTNSNDKSWRSLTIKDLDDAFQKLGVEKLSKNINGIVAIKGWELNKKSSENDKQVEETLPNGIIITGIDESKTNDREIMLQSSMLTVNKQKDQLKRKVRFS